MTNVFTSTRFYQSSLEAGSGKSTTLFKQIAATTPARKTIIAFPKITNMTALTLKFELARRKLSGEYQYFGDSVIVCNSTHEGDVQTQIADAITTVKNSSTKHTIFITHSALQSYDRWPTIKQEFDLVIDETFDYFTQHDLMVSLISSTSKFWDCFKARDNTTSGEYAELELTAHGRECMDNKRDLFFDHQQVRDVFLLANNSNTKLAAKPGDMYQQREKFSLYSLFSADVLLNFARVTFLCDGFSNSPLCRYIESYLDIKFEELAITAYNQRVLPLNQRVTIHQLTNSNPSGLRLAKQMTPEHYAAITNTINQLTQGDAIWTSNKRFMSNFGYLKANYLSPRQAGLNEYNNCTTAIWLASMKTSCSHIKCAQDFIGLDRNDFDTIRELEPMHQFVARTNMRDYLSTKPLTIIVFGPQQAEYLADKYMIDHSNIVKHNLATSQVTHMSTQALSPAKQQKWYALHNKIKRGTPITPRAYAWLETACVALDRELPDNINIKGKRA